ncbi:hypothetical protein [Paraburkholderia sp. DHOC27]|uniref:hypothetical protein n=1 Tax=Paraburkholderia sp. DHOC27 TaxID=2303330 RepID=UPI000E3C8373|nr:hypothetical protein [Paraburkholderia sp. DHOC27]RFU45009.1 hypothetical protein D0B32_25015 [Paraburkholderia sp. DHOC27]
MKITVRLAAIGLFIFCVCRAHAGEFHGIPVREALTLNEGINDIQVAGQTVRVIRAFVGTLTAHSYETYTSFVLPTHSAGTWARVLVDQPDGNSADLTTIESADSMVQSVAVFMRKGVLFAVQATKTGAVMPALYLDRSTVTFKVFRFNGNRDMARFTQEQRFESKEKYMNADDALKKEFFVD